MLTLWNHGVGRLSTEQWEKGGCPVEGGYGGENHGWVIVVQRRTDEG